MKYQILQGDNRETLKTIPDNSIDAIVTDPPYGIDFLGKSWDANTGAVETYQECLRVLKPGGHILAFSAARTYHHLAVTLEQAGFEIRDQIMWIYSSGFPKSQDIGKSIERSENKRKDNALGIKRSKIESGPKTSCPKCNKTLNGTNQNTCEESQCDLRDALAPADNEWSGWGTQLKPAHEPIALARKPIRLSIARNCQVHGVGALNIDACRVPYEDGQVIKGGAKIVKMDEAWSENLDKTSIAENNWTGDEGGRFPSNVIGSIPLYQKYFYCPKVSRRERHIGHDLPPPMFGDVAGAYGPDGNRMAVGFDDRAKIATEDKKGNGLDRVCETCGVSVMKPQDCSCDVKSWVRPIKTGNNHPTVKPIELMKYLIRLITPPGGVVLDPFNGSGSTGCAAVELGMTYIGCELDPAYVEIAQKRIAAWNQDSTTFSELFE